MIDKSLPSSARYVRRCEMIDSGKYIIHCQFVKQSHMLYKATTLYIDKTFKRSKKCNEIEFNAYDSAQQRTTTLARVYTNLDDTRAYEHVFRMVFDQAAHDVGSDIIFDCLQPVIVLW